MHFCIYIKRKKYDSRCALMRENWIANFHSYVRRKFIDLQRPFLREIPLGNFPLLLLLDYSLRASSSSSAPPLSSVKVSNPSKLGPSSMNRAVGSVVAGSLSSLREKDSEPTSEEFSSNSPDDQPERDTGVQ